jgi:hypothetical protein
MCELQNNIWGCAVLCCGLQDINEFLTNELKARSVATTQVS